MFKKNDFKLPLMLAVLSVSTIGCSAHQVRYVNGTPVRNIEPAEWKVPQASSTKTQMTALELERTGDMYFHSGNFASSLVQYDKLLKSGIDKADIHYKKGRVLLAGKLYQDAIDSFVKVTEKSPDNGMAYQGIGEAFFAMEEYDQAKKNFQMAIEKDHNLWKAYNFLGIISDYRREYEKAVDAYRKAIRISPKNGMLYNNLGVSYALAEKNGSAVDSFLSAIRLNYSASKLYNNLGLVLCRMSKFKEALEAFKNGGSRACAHNNLGVVMLRQNEVSGAITQFKIALALDQDYEKAKVNLRTARVLESGDSITIEREVKNVIDMRHHDFGGNL